MITYIHKVYFVTNSQKFSSKVRILEKSFDQKKCLAIEMYTILSRLESIERKIDSSTYRGNDFTPDMVTAMMADIPPPLPSRQNDCQRRHTMGNWSNLWIGSVWLRNKCYEEVQNNLHRSSHYRFWSSGRCEKIFAPIRHSARVARALRQISVWS